MTHDGPSERTQVILTALTAGIAALILGGVAYALWPKGGSTVTVPVETVPPGAVVYYASKGFYLVREGETFWALRDSDPAGACRVAWRPDLVAETVVGVFHSPCTGRIYDRHGRAVSGGPPLQPLHLERKQDALVIDPERPAAG